MTRAPCPTYSRQPPASSLPLGCGRSPALRFLGLKRGGQNRKRGIAFYQANGPFDMETTFPDWWPV
ncbi:MAG: hypothetical protein ABIO70_04745 [Pseudomonadota bacterium]